MAFTAVLAIGVAVTAAGTAVQMSASKKAAKASQRAAEAQRRQEQVAQQRERVKQVREARIKRAQIIQAGENQGAAGSSSVIGGQYSVAQQANQNIGYTLKQEGLGNEVYNQNTIIRKANKTEQLGQGISAMGSSAINYAGMKL